MAHGQLLFQSPFLLVVGLAMLGGLVVLGKVYWFSAPFTGISISLACYVASIALSRDDKTFRPTCSLRGDAAESWRIMHLAALALALVFLAAPLAASAQQPPGKSARIGLLGDVCLRSSTKHSGKGCASWATSKVRTSRSRSGCRVEV